MERGVDVLVARTQPPRRGDEDIAAPKPLLKLTISECAPLIRPHPNNPIASPSAPRINHPMVPDGSKSPDLPPLQTSMDPATRHTLLESVVNGSDRWAELSDRYRPLMMAIARDAGLGFHDSEEVTQNAFITLVRSFQRFEVRRQPGSFRAFLRSVVLSRIRDLLRARSRRPAEVALETLDPHPGHEPTAPDTSEERFFAETVAQALLSLHGTLSPRDLQVLHKLYLEGLNTQETALQLHTSPANVEKIRSRTRQRFYRHWLREYWHGSTT
jgi:RNA polymerase sigma factor (sigma-70 family)